MEGFGVSAFVSSAYGLWTPEDAPAPATGDVGSRWINPQTKDYEINQSTGNLKQMPSVRQQIMLALSTIQGSAAMTPRFGVAMPNKMNNAFENAAKNACRIALSHLTDGDFPIIRIDNLVVTRGRNSRVEILVDYTDLSTGERDKAVV